MLMQQCSDGYNFQAWKLTRCCELSYAFRYWALNALHCACLLLLKSILPGLECCMNTEAAKEWKISHSLLESFTAKDPKIVTSMLSGNHQGETNGFLMVQAPPSQQGVTTSQGHPHVLSSLLLIILPCSTIIPPHGAALSMSLPVAGDGNSEVSSPHPEWSGLLKVPNRVWWSCHAIKGEELLETPSCPHSRRKSPADSYRPSRHREIYLASHGQSDPFPDWLPHSCRWWLTQACLPLVLTSSFSSGNLVLQT